MIFTLRGWALTAATTWLLLVGALAVWSTVPVALGWRAIVVVSGSMEPRVHVGDVVLVDPQLRTPKRGQVILVRDGTTATGTRLHRVVRIEAGTYITRGDANQSEDSTPVSPADVEGTARLLVASAGRFTMLTRNPVRADWVWAGATAFSVLILIAVPAPRVSRRRAEPDPRELDPETGEAPVAVGV